jgi:hypothetical protein
MTHLRTYIAGLGSGGALIAAVIVALIALGGVVAVEGLPDSSHSASAEDVLVQNEVPGTDVTNAPSTQTGAQARGRGRIGGGTRGKPAQNASGGGGSRFGDATATAAPVPQPLPPADVSDDLPSLTPPLADPPSSSPHHPPHHNPPPFQPPSLPPPTGPVPVPTEQGPVGGLVGVVNETVRGATGADPHLPEVLAPVATPVDDILGGLTHGGGGNVPPLP